MPLYLGVGHKTKEELLTNYTTSSFNRLLDKDEDNLMLILDGTYLYIQKPSDLEFQKLAYSVQKNRHLLKVMMIITTSGYVVEARGLYAADGKNNDSSLNFHIHTLPMHNTDQIHWDQHFLNAC